MAAEGIDVSDLHLSIERATTPASAADRRPVQRALRRIALQLARPQARRQQLIDRQLLGVIETLAAHLSTLRTGVDELRTWLHNSERGSEELRQWSHELAARVDGLAAQVDGLAAWSDELAPTVAFVEASRNAPDPSSLGLERFDAELTGRVLGYQNGALSVRPEDDYAAFEDVFRLSEDVIRERQRPYVDLLEGRTPVLDAGCGRGEFLELLREAGITASGVDLDAGMVARARAKGLEVHHGDAVDYLESLEDHSLGVVFAAQVVEHLPYDRLLAFLRLSARKLGPGGMLIAETVNPHAPGALKNFWLDLTHQHPVFPEVLLTLCRAIGFGRAYIFHPGGTGDAERDRERIGDYALIAERPPAT